MRIPLLVQGPVGVSNKHVETAIDEGSGKLTMLYQVSMTKQTSAAPCDQRWALCLLLDLQKGVPCMLDWAAATRHTGLIPGSSAGHDCSELTSACFCNGIGCHGTPIEACSCSGDLH